MKIKFGSIVTDGRGKLGGHVYSKNRGGNYIRTNIIPINPQTPTQMAARGNFGSISSAWKSLTDLQREQWRSFAVSNKYQDLFGDSKELTGNSAFVRSNMNLTSGNQTQIQVPHEAKEDARVVLSELVVEYDGSVSAADLTMEISSALADTAEMGDATIVIHATAPFPASQKFAKNRFRVLTSITKNQVSQAISIKDAYVAVHGLPPVGTRIAVKLVLIKTNGLSSLIGGLDTVVEEL